MPSRIKLRPRSTPPTPGPDSETLFLDEEDGVLKSIDSEGVVTAVEGAGGGAGTPLSFDNTIDPPTDITSLVAAGGTVVGSEATLRGKDFYAQDTDPGSVGAGSVWKDTSLFPTETWWRRNGADDGWDAEFAPTVAAVGDAIASATVSATTTGAGNALSGGNASTEGAGTADARQTATAQVGPALAGPRATAHGAETADVTSVALTDSTGDAVAVLDAHAEGDGDATVTAVARADGAGVAYAGSLATRLGVSAGMNAQVAAGEVPRLGFNGISDPPPLRPELPATPDAQDIADVLVALGLVTQGV